METLFVLYQDVYLQVKRSLIDQQFWDIREDRLMAYLTAAGIRAYWEENRSKFSPEFVQYVEERRTPAPSAGG